MITHTTRVAATLALAFAVAPEGHAERLPAKLFAQHAQYSSVALSPDGTHLAIATPVDNHTDLMIVDLSGKTPPSRLKSLPKEHILDPFWANDNRLVFGKGKKADYLEQPGNLGELYSVNREMKEQKIMFGYQPDVGNRPGRKKDQGWASVIARRGKDRNTLIVQFQSWDEHDKNTYIYRLDPDKVDRKMIEKVPLESASVVVDHDSVPRFAATVDLQYNPILRYRPTADADWQPVPKAITGHNMQVLRFAKDNNTAWALITDKGEPEVLYKVDFAKGTREKVMSAGDYAVGSLIGAGFDGEPFAVYSDAPKPSIQYLDNTSEWAKLHAGLMKQFAGNLVWMEEFSRDDSKVLVHVSGDRNPGQYYLLDRSKNSIAKVLDSYENVDPNKFAPMRIIEFPTSDELKLSAMLTVPTTGTAPYPMVVMSHGGPFGINDTWGFDTDAQFFANRGYAVLQVNFRGSGGRGETFERSGYREWGGKIMDDIAAGVRYTIDNGLADKDRICTFGASFGGYAALMNPIRYPDLYKCAIGYVGVYDLAYMATKGDIDDTKRGRFYVETAVGTDEAKTKAESPVHNVDKLKVPVMLVHGKDDQRVPLVHYKVMSEALERAGRPAESLVKDAEGHGFYKEENRIELYEKMEAFLAKHIGKSNASN
jgi:dipeptidyl aminopeptidase/acylaminoacyl peptidase